MYLQRSGQEYAGKIRYGVSDRIDRERVFADQGNQNNDGFQNTKGNGYGSDSILRNSQTERQAFSKFPKEDMIYFHQQQCR